MTMFRTRGSTAVSSVLCVTERINELLTQSDSDVLKGVKEKVCGVVEALRSTSSFLRDSDQSEERVNDLVVEIQDLAHEGEDVIETFVVQITSKREGAAGIGMLPSSSKRSCACSCFAGSDSERRNRIIQETTSKIENIISKITGKKSLISQVYRYPSPDQKLIGKEIVVGSWDGDKGSSSSSSSSRNNNKKKKEEQYSLIVGFDDHVENLVRILVDDKSEWQVVCIRSECGAGKTTLAKMLYHHKAVRDHFDGQAWVYVGGYNCKKERKIWEQILDGLAYVGTEASASAADGNKQEQEAENGDLAEKLYKFLKDNKFLVVLDDIRDIRSWDSIASAFPSKGEMRSKILVTTMVTVHIADAYDCY